MSGGAVTPGSRDVSPDGECGGAGRLLAVSAAVVLALCFAGANHLWDASVREDYSYDEKELAEGAAGGDVLRRLGFLTLAGCGSLGAIFGRAGRWRLPFVSQEGAGAVTGAALFAFFGWWGASVFWSDDPPLTIRRTAVVGLYLIGVVGAAKALTGRRLVQAAVGVVSLHLVAGLAVELGFRTFVPWQTDYRFSGTIHPNIQALQLAAGTCGCVALSGLFHTERLTNGRVRGWWLLWAALKSHNSLDRVGCAVSNSGRV